MESRSSLARHHAPAGMRNRLTRGSQPTRLGTVGNVAAETQTLNRTGGAGSPNPTLAYGQTESFSYDAANRVTASSFDGTLPEARTYTYDADSNRTSVVEAGVTFYYFYDATDELRAKNTTNTAPTGTVCASGNVNFCYDTTGNLRSSVPSTPDSSSLLATTYTYDAAGHLLTIDDGTAAQKVTFSIDALGRHLTQTIGTGAATTYAYLGASDQVTATTRSGTTTYSAIDAIGDRLAQGSTSAVAGYLIADLHGNVVAAISNDSSPVFLDAYRYDPYGETVGSWTASSGSLTVPWRFQGRILESSASATDLYDFSARSYDPSLGAFTAFDSVSGSAQNPLTLNRYLYAAANPATLVDPDGHAASNSLDDAISGWHNQTVTSGYQMSTAPSLDDTVSGWRKSLGDAATDRRRRAATAPAPAPCADPSRWCGNTNTKPAGPTCWSDNSCGANTPTPLDNWRQRLASGQGLVGGNACDNIVCGFTNTVGDTALQVAPYVLVGLGAWGACTLITFGAGSGACLVLVAGSIGGYYGGTLGQNVVGNKLSGRDLFDDPFKGANLRDYTVSVAVPVIGRAVTALDPLQDAVSSNGATAFLGDLANQASTGEGHVNFCQAGLTALLTAAVSRKGMPDKGLPGAAFGAMTSIANTLTNALAGVCR